MLSMPQCEPLLAGYGQAQQVIYTLDAIEPISRSILPIRLVLFSILLGEQSLSAVRRNVDSAFNAYGLCN